MEYAIDMYFIFGDNVVKGQCGDYGKDQWPLILLFYSSYGYYILCNWGNMN